MTRQGCRANEQRTTAKKAAGCWLLASFSGLATPGQCPVPCAMRQALPARLRTFPSHTRPRRPPPPVECPGTVSGYSTIIQLYLDDDAQPLITKTSSLRQSFCILLILSLWTRVPKSLQGSPETTQYSPTGKTRQTRLQTFEQHHICPGKPTLSL